MTVRMKDMSNRRKVLCSKFGCNNRSNPL